MILTKVPSGAFIPANEEDYQEASLLKPGDQVLVTLKQQRALWKHRKFFAMLKVGFEAWSESYNSNPVMHRGVPVLAEMERFRKDVIILAGYCKTVWNIDGEMRLEAESISFGNMGQERFEKLYNAVANVLLQKVLKNYTRDDLDTVVQKLIRF